MISVPVNEEAVIERKVLLNTNVGPVRFHKVKNR